MHLHFNTTSMSQLAIRSAAAIQFVEMRVHKKLLSQRTVSLLESSNCGVILRLFAASAQKDEYDLISESILSTESLKVDEWISLGNLSELYYSWITDNNRTVQTVKLDMLASCGGARPTFNSAFRVNSLQLMPVMVAYMNETEKVNVQRDHGPRPRIHRRSVEVLQNASCDVYSYEVSCHAQKCNSLNIMSVFRTIYVYRSCCPTTSKMCLIR